MTIIECPHCKASSIKKMTYSDLTEFERGFKKGGFSLEKEGGEMAPAKPEGVTDCTACGKKFMFKFDIAVVCRTAPYPFEEVKET